MLLVDWRRLAGLLGTFAVARLEATVAHNRRRSFERALRRRGREFVQHATGGQRVHVGSVHVGILRMIGNVLWLVLMLLLHMLMDVVRVRVANATSAVVRTDAVAATGQSGDIACETCPKMTNSYYDSLFSGRTVVMQYCSSVVICRNFWYTFSI